MYEELVKKQREKAECFDYDGRPDIACDYEEAADAIEELSEFRERMNHIFAVQYLFYYSEHVVQERVAYFNDTEIQEDEVGRVIHDDFYDPRVVVMARVQAEKVFGYKWIEKETPPNNEGV